jgi:hypothetical protein
MKLMAPQSLRPQEIVVIKIAPAHLEPAVSKTLVPIEVPIS